jgi:RHS repeat-associated protein
MTKKVSTSAVSPKRTIGAGLNYTYDQYDYYAGFPHRLERVGNMYYRYDGNGNVIAEREGGHATTDSRNATVYNDGDLYYTDYGFGLFQEGQTDTKVYERKYTWNERNLLSSSVDRQYAVTYRYGADGQRAAKYAVRGTTSVETMYFNQFWSSRTTATSEMLESKHIFVGTSRVVTKLHRKGDDSVDYEGKNRYYYHSDHLGSAQLVTDFKGLEYERIEYTPYGELWVEKTIAGSERLPFRFTGKEFDEETGLYYYGARYLDPKVSRWLSTDPAVGEYIPSAPVNDEARRRNGNLPGMGGIYNLVNFHLYHYAGNNPVRYIDPDGRDHGIALEAPIYNQNKYTAEANVVAYVFRDPASYSTLNGKNVDLRGRDTLMIVNRKTGEMIAIPISSVPTMPGTEIGDAIAPGEISLTLGPKVDSKFSPVVMTISGGKLISGDILLPNGTTENNTIPWRVHDTGFFGSLGCFVGQRDNRKGSVADIINKLRSWGVEYGDVIPGYLMLEREGH